MKELHIRLSERQPGTYQAEIVAPPPKAESFELPAGADWPCQLELPQFPGSNRTLADFQRHLLSLKPNDPNELEAIGGFLYNFLFGPDSNKRNVLYEYWTTCLNESPKIQVEGVRTVLQLDSPSLIGVPWELCNENGDYLAVHIPHTLLRTAWKATGGLKKEPVPLPDKTQDPLRVLLVISHKEQDVSVKGPDEALSVDAALFNLLPWMVDLHILIRPTISEVREWCEDWEPHILHFVGHGGATAGGNPYLQLYESGQANATRIDQNAFINLFKAKVPRLVVLNACRSGQASNVDTNMAAAQATQSFSARLIQKGVLAVIAMQADIEGEDAVALMREFYHKLAKGKAIDEALTFARDHRFGEASLSPNQKWDWALPALYLAKDIRAEQVLCLDETKAASTIFPIDQKQDWLPLSMGVKIHVGREKEQLILEKTVLAPDLTTIPPITLLHGVQDIGKSTMLYWLSEGCVRRGRSFIYADFGHASLNYWDVLRLIRDGWLETVKGVRLAHHFDSDLFFNTFNDALNRKTLPNYTTEFPKKPDEATAVKDKASNKNLTIEIGNQGTVRSDENPFETITNEFRNGLVRVAGSDGLIIFLDHIEMLIPDTVERMRTYLIEPILAAGSNSSLSKIRLVLAIRDIDPAGEFLLGQSASGKAWNFLFELAQQNGSSMRKLQFEGLPHERLHWLAQVWGRRYFLSCSGPTFFKQYLKYFLDGRNLKPEQVDAYVKRRVDSYAQVAKAPGELIRNLLEETYIRDWLKTL